VIAARLCGGAGDLAGALQRSRDAVEYTRRVGDIGNGTYALNDAVHTLAAHNEHVAAAEIIGALEGGVMRVMAYQFVGTEADRRDSTHQRLEETLGDAEFNAAWARGAAMTADEVSLAAITKLDELLVAAETPPADIPGSRTT
jgi:hypothetical protein